MLSNKRQQQEKARGVLIHSSPLFTIQILGQLKLNVKSPVNIKSYKILTLINCNSWTIFNLCAICFDHID